MRFLTIQHLLILLCTIIQSSAWEREGTVAVGSVVRLPHANFSVVYLPLGSSSRVSSARFIADVEGEFVLRDQRSRDVMPGDAAREPALVRPVSA